jgi:hypothetical protein
MQGNIPGVVRILNLIGLYISNILLTCWRYLIIFYHSSFLCWQQQKLRRRFSRWGETILTFIIEGDPNPLLQEQVKDQLEMLKALNEQKTARREAIRLLREKIKATSYKLPPEANVEKGDSL